MKSANTDSINIHIIQKLGLLKENFQTNCRRLSTMTPKQKSFEHFYLTKVALGDCCGCAERVIDWRDIDLEKQRSRLKPIVKKKSFWQRVKKKFRF